ncbi:hypothetical protein BJP36_42705 [Moorena producens JHB]|uniref:Uncharacterized protein n=1 Tax=Moorena producens (strain JHB) TaxID=1454205 RepID=A0A9Q9SSY1_MOOP1|nr:hypothetical protein [Moorena producens]WAN69070.1 hypothetical protein BJP36_42705 [Moorena producens JHB]
MSDNFCPLFPTPYSLLPVPCSLFPVPFALRVSRSDRLPTDSKCLGIPPIRSKTDFWD